MTWQRVRIKIVSHPWLEVGKVYEAERDENGWYYVRTEDTGYGVSGTVFPDEAEEVADGTSTIRR